MMTQTLLRHLRRPVAVAVLCAATAVPLFVATPALAWWRGGLAIGIAPPPLYYPPPAYYPPPPFG